MQIFMWKTLFLSLLWHTYFLYKISRKSWTCNISFLKLSQENLGAKYLIVMKRNILIFLNKIIYFSADNKNIFHKLKHTHESQTFILLHWFLWEKVKLNEERKREKMSADVLYSFILYSGFIYLNKLVSLFSKLIFHLHSQ